MFVEPVAAANLSATQYLFVGSVGAQTWADATSTNGVNMLEHFDSSSSRRLSAFSTAADKLGATPLGLVVTNQVVVEYDGWGKLTAAPWYSHFVFTVINPVTGAIEHAYLSSGWGITESGSMTVVDHTMFLLSSAPGAATGVDVINLDTGKVVGSVIIGVKGTEPRGDQAQFAVFGNELWFLTSPNGIVPSPQQFVEVNTMTHALVTHFDDPLGAGTQYFAADSNTLFVPVLKEGANLIANDGLAAAPQGSHNAIAKISTTSGLVTGLISGPAYQFPSTSSQATPTWTTSGGIVTDGQRVWVADSGTSKMTSFNAVNGALPRITSVGSGNSSSDGVTRITLGYGRILAATRTGIFGYSTSNGRLVNVMH